MPFRRNIVLTGGTSGIGRASAHTLASLENTRLILVARDENKAEATRAALMRAAAGTKVDLVYADFRSLQTVAAAAEDIGVKYGRVDVLINNAGIHAFRQRVTADGFAEMVSVNHLSPWLLTARLRGCMERSSRARVVTVASEASRHYVDSLDPVRALSDTTPFTRLGSSVIYGRTKLMNIMFSLELTQQLAAGNITVNCLNPGFNVTGLGRELPFAATIERFLRFIRIGDPGRGATIIARLATDPIFATVSGAYVTVPDAQPLTPTALANDAAARRTLWTATAEILRAYF